ncbi:Tyrosine-protein kinase JAK2, partial [Takifugu flavidus]
SRAAREDSVPDPKRRKAKNREANRAARVGEHAGHSEVDACFQELMACILLPDMDSATISPTTPHNDVLPAQELASTLEPKQDPSAPCLTVHLYHQVKDSVGGGAKGSESTLTFPAGQYVAEELCINAAKACVTFPGPLLFLVTGGFWNKSTVMFSSLMTPQLMKMMTDLMFREQDAVFTGARPMSSQPALTR